MYDNPFLTLTSRAFLKGNILSRLTETTIPATTDDNTKFTDEESSLNVICN